MDDYFRRLVWFFWKIWKFRTKIKNYFRTETFEEWSGQFDVVAFSLGARFGLFWAISQFECEIFWIFNQNKWYKDDLRLTNNQFDTLLKEKFQKNLQWKSCSDSSKILIFWVLLELRNITRDLKYFLFLREHFSTRIFSHDFLQAMSAITGLTNRSEKCTEELQHASVFLIFWYYFFLVWNIAFIDYYKSSNVLFNHLGSNKK